MCTSRQEMKSSWDSPPVEYILCRKVPLCYSQAGLDPMLFLTESASLPDVV